MIPCEEYVLIGLREKDVEGLGLYYVNTSSSVMVSCKEGPMSVDLLVQRTESYMTHYVQAFEELISGYAISAMGPVQGIFVSVFTNVIGDFIVNFADDESNSYYSLHLEGVTHSSIVADQDLM